MPNETPSSKTGAQWALYLILVLLAVAVVALAVMNATRSRAPAQLESENASLRDRVMQLESELRRTGQPVPPAATSTPPAPEPAPTSGPAPANGRLLLTTDRYEDFNFSAQFAKNNYKDLAQEESVYASPWNFDAPNRTERYVDATRGFQVDLPYNDRWGNNIFRLPAYDVEAGGKTVWYGPIGGAEGGGWVREYHLSLVTSTDAEARVQQIRETTPIEFLEVQPSIITINGRKTVRWAESGLCTVPVLEVTGAAFNIVIAPICGTAEASSFEKLEAVARTIEFR